MPSSDPRRLTAVLVAASVMSACSSATQSASTAAQPAAQPAAPSASTAVGYDALAKARIDSASHLYTPADVHFMSGMIAHHSQAITMARMAPSHGASPSVLTLASRIINAQQDEIATMQQWLRDRKLPVPDPSRPMSAMSMPGMTMGDGGLMPGMLTPEQMAQLDSARGPAFDRLFLTDMIQHHTGALTMVKALFDSYGAGQDELVFKFASDVNVDQTTEIARMQRLLVALAFAHPSQQ